MIPTPRFDRRALLGVSLLALSLFTAPLLAQQRDCCRGIEDFGFRQHHHDRPARVASQQVGQGAIAAIQEVVGLLLADPRTDWSEVSISRLRQHLVDLDLLVESALVEERAVDGGLEIRVSGNEASLAAAKRRVPAHARALDGFRGWSISAQEESDAVVLSVRCDQPEELPVLRALGFYGLMSAGVHRPHQLLAIARGRLGEQEGAAGGSGN